MRNATVLMSGGIDSAACAHLLAWQGNTSNAVFINHGQAAAAAEERAVREITTRMGANLSCYSVLGSEPFTAGELVGRNAFLVFAALFLTRARPGILAMGIHGGTPYWDCSEGFAREMEKLVAEHTDGKVVFMAPFLTWSKSEVYEYFLTTGIDVSVTYSCEAGTTGAERLTADTTLALNIFADAMRHMERRGSQQRLTGSAVCISEISTRAIYCANPRGLSSVVAFGY